MVVLGWQGSVFLWFLLPNGTAVATEPFRHSHTCTCTCEPSSSNPGPSTFHPPSLQPRFQTAEHWLCGTGMDPGRVDRTEAPLSTRRDPEAAFHVIILDSSLQKRKKNFLRIHFICCSKRHLRSTDDQPINARLTTNVEPSGGGGGGAAVFWDFLDLQINPFTVLNCIQTYTEFTKNCQTFLFWRRRRSRSNKENKITIFKLFFSFLDKTTIEWSKDFNSDLLFCFFKDKKKYVHQHLLYRFFCVGRKKIDGR